VSQQRLFEFRMGERAPETLVVTAANQDAAQLLTEWKSWPGGALALVGPQGSGKTHLALAWAMETGARELAPDASPEDAVARFEESGRIFIDGADGQRDEAMLWRLLDLARARRGAILMTAAAPPSAWVTTIPDLRSRLSAMAVARLKEPDEALLEVVLRRLCREQFIQLREDAAKYLAARMPRTFAAARDVAEALDQSIIKGSRPVTVAMARRALERAQSRWGAVETE
jgi:chromosomal replication initiation ATPase DnaA